MTLREFRRVLFQAYEQDKETIIMDTEGNRYTLSRVEGTDLGEQPKVIIARKYYHYHP